MMVRKEIGALYLSMESSCEQILYTRAEENKSRGKYIIVDDIWNGKNILTG
jgi:hypothetical protein